MSFRFLLLEPQRLCGVVHITVGQFACVAPARPGVKSEDERTVYLGFLTVETCRHKTVYFFGEQYFLLQRHVVVLDYEATAGIFLDKVFVNSRRHHALEHPEIGFRAVALSVGFQIFHKRPYHFGCQLLHFKAVFEFLVSRSGLKKPYELFQTAFLRLPDMLGKRRRFAELTAELDEIIVHLLAQTVTLAVFEECLLTLEAYLLGKRECVPVLQSLLRCSGMKPDVEVEVLLFTGMLDFEFGFPRHCPFGVEHLLTILVKYGSLGSSDIVFQIEAGASVAQYGLLELGILFLAIFYFCHKS